MCVNPFLVQGLYVFRIKMFHLLLKNTTFGYPVHLNALNKLTYELGGKSVATFAMIQCVIEQMPNFCILVPRGFDTTAMFDNQWIRTGYSFMQTGK